MDLEFRKPKRKKGDISQCPDPLIISDLKKWMLM
jgi:hypothetical protein